MFENCDLNKFKVSLFEFAQRLAAQYEYVLTASPAGHFKENEFSKYLVSLSL